MAVTREQVIDYLSALSPDGLQALILELEDVWGIERPALPEQVDDYATMGMPNTDVWRVVMTEVGPDRVAVMKALRELLRLSLIDARRFVDTMPAIVRDEISREEANALTERLAAAGALVEVQMDPR